MDGHNDRRSCSLFFLSRGGIEKKHTRPVAEEAPWRLVAFSVFGATKGFRPWLPRLGNAFCAGRSNQRASPIFFAWQNTEQLPLRSSSILWRRLDVIGHVHFPLFFDSFDNKRRRTVHKTLFPPHAVVTRAGPLKISQHFAHEGDYSSGTCFCRRKKLQVRTGSTTQHDSNKEKEQKLTFLLTLALSQDEGVTTVPLHRQHQGLYCCSAGSDRSINPFFEARSRV